ncbi:MAG: O-antigen ligase family protein [Gaiellales bacterium]
MSTPGAAVESPRADFGRLEWRALLPGLLAFAVVAPLAAANGGYNPPSWGWSAAALLWVAGLALVFTDCDEVSTAEQVTLAGLLGLTVWILLSALWSGAAGSAAMAAERMLVYVGGVAALALIARRGSTVTILAGTLAALTVVVGDGLVGLLFPSTTELHGVAQTGRLSAPEGYWNGMGITAALGVLLALGLAARCQTMLGRVAAALTLPVLATGLYLTFSRGAWISLGFGLLVALALDGRRWQLFLTALAVLPWLAIDVGMAVSSSALTHMSSPVDPTTSQGHRLTLVMIASAVPLVAAVIGVQLLERQWSPGRTLTRAGRAIALVLCAAALITPVGVYGSPAKVWDRVYSGFSAAAPGGFKQGRNLNARLFSLSGNARLTLWKAAWHDYQDHPVLGGGAGQYQTYWAANRPSTLRAVNAHSLYLETLAELGPVGLALLLLALVPALVAAVRARAHPLVAPALGVYAAFLLHTGADWDWQLPGVTLAALAVAVAIMVAARPEGESRLAVDRIRMGAIVVVVVLAVAAVYGLRVNLALSRSADAAATSNWSSALSNANTAASWAPWLETSWIAVGEARLGAGDRSGAASAFHHAADDNPYDWQPWYGLARATTGAESGAALAHALRLDPHEPVLTDLRASR